MTIADEGASRAYMYVPPIGAKNRTKSPDGSNGSAKSQPKKMPNEKAASQGATPKKKVNQR
ncbi:hypothetical protein GCM10028818_50520 [Spirosoma horti]